MSAAHGAPDRIFDGRLIRSRLARAAAKRPADFLLTRTAEDIADRLSSVQRRFSRLADIGTPAPHLTSLLRAKLPDALIVRASPSVKVGDPTFLQVVADPETLPLAPGAFDLAVSALALQCTNDLPGALVQIRRALMPDGLFLGALLGGRTLTELRTVLTEAEVETTGGASPRIAPFADVRDMGGLLQRAGFALPVADSECVTVRYANAFDLMTDLRAMGATNALAARSRRPTPRALFLRAATLYGDRFADPDGRIRATFEIVSLSGWAPHESQAKPARRGSGRISLAVVLGDRSGDVS